MRDAGNASPPDARIVSRAVEPSVPSFPKKLPIVAIATLAAAMLAMGAIVARELLGAESQLNGEGGFWNGFWQYQQLRSRGNTIEAGTSEILRNIVAERVLCLPRSR